MILEELYTALITPFTFNGELDREGLRFNLRYQLQQGIKGIVVLGTTGEASTLTLEEKNAVIEIAVEEVQGKASLFVGTGSNDTASTISATLRAKERGADGALIITPYYNKPTQEGLFRHFSAICDATAFPIVLYNAPSRTGQNLEPATLKRLLTCTSIVGVKDCSGNMMQVSDLLELVHSTQSKVAIFAGDDALTLPVISLGGKGLFSVASNLIPGPVLKLVQMALQDNWECAQLWHRQLYPFFKGIFLETNPIPIKAALQMCGLPAGSCRLPLCDLSPSTYQQLKHLVDELPSIWFGEYGQKKSSRC